jgi:glycogen synthase kinase 3 beta
MSIAPNLNHKLVPAHMIPVLQSQGLDIDNFTPLSREDMMAKLD